MKNIIKLLTIAMALIIMSGATLAQSAQKKSEKYNLQAAPALTVQGGGTLGRLTKWTGFTSSNSLIGDSNIFEDKYGKVGIGVAPTDSILSVGGLIHSLSGGFKFPDGTVQATASVTGLTSIFRDATLIGNGTSGSPLGIALPLRFSKSLPDSGVVDVTNNGHNGLGVRGESAGGGSGVLGVSDSGIGVRGISTSLGDGVVGQGGFVGAGGSGSLAGTGVIGLGGFNNDGHGGRGVLAAGGKTNTGTAGDGVFAVGGFSDFFSGGAGGNGIVAIAGSGSDASKNGLAGKFIGNVEVTGTLSKGGGSFKIDHPLDPANMYLYHSFVESPDMMNVYNGNITTDENGEATVTLPDYFEALNRDFRYQLTVIGTFAQAMVADEIKNNRFVIRTSAPGVKVSWQVTGIRQDAWANKNRIQVEIEKPERERGYYLYPAVLNQPEERSVEWTRNPDLMRQRRPGLSKSEK